MDRTPGSPNTILAGMIQTAGGASMGTIQILAPSGRISATNVLVTGDLGRAQVRGDFADGSSIHADGDVGQVLMLGRIVQSTVSVDGTTGLLKASGGQAGSILSLNGGAASMLLSGGLSGSRAAVIGDVSRLFISGAIEDHSRVLVTGATGSFRSSAGISDHSIVTLAGDVTSARIGRDAFGESIDATSMAVLGGLTKTLTTAGTVAGTIDITGSAAGSKIRITGDLSAGAALFAGVFGDVTLTGRLEGVITGRAAGIDNMLKVGASGGAGMVTADPQAFAACKGYTV